MNKYDEIFMLNKELLKACRKCRALPIQKVEMGTLGGQHFLEISCPHGCRRIGLEFTKNIEFLGAVHKLTEHWNGK